MHKNGLGLKLLGIVLVLAFYLAILFQNEHESERRSLLTSPGNQLNRWSPLTF